MNDMIPNPATPNFPASQAHIGVLYSYAPHFRKALQTLREAYPKARITALVPPGFPLGSIQGLADETLPLAPAPQVRRGFLAAWQLLQGIRGQRFTDFVVLFSSAKLQALAGLSGAQRCYCFGLDNTLRPLQMRLFSTLMRMIARRTRGQLLYWRIWLHVRLTPMGSSPPASKDHHAAGNKRRTP